MYSTQNSGPQFYSCECAKGTQRDDPDGRSHHYLCCEAVSKMPGTGRVADVVLDRCLHDEPERCLYLKSRA